MPPSLGEKTFFSIHLIALQRVKKLVVRLFARATEMNGDGIAPPRVAGHRTAQFAQMFLQPVHTSTIDVQCSFICKTQLRERFQGDSAVVDRSLLLPTFCNRASFNEIEELPQPYSSFLPERTCHCFRNRTVALEIDRTGSVKT